MCNSSCYCKKLCAAGCIHSVLPWQVITHANTFTSAVQKMQRALVEFHIRGVKTNIPFLENVLRHPEFLAGDATTSFIERNPQLFSFGTRDGLQASKLLGYLAELARHCLLQQQAMSTECTTWLSPAFQHCHAISQQPANTPAEHAALLQLYSLLCLPSP